MTTEHIRNEDIKIALIQTECTDDIHANLEKTIAFIREAAHSGAKIILLQELFAWPYFCQKVDDLYFKWAESVSGPIVTRMKEMAAELEVVIVVPFFEKRALGLYHNTAVVIDANGKLLGTYRKMHIPDDPGFHEKYYFAPGDLGYKTFSTQYGCIGILICWDQWYPEPARITAMMGANLLVYPTAIAYLPHEEGESFTQYLDAWQTIQKSHAIANGCYVASINRTGNEGNLSFWGHSFVCGPFGQIIAQADAKENIIYSHIIPSSLDRHRTTWPFFRDRRIDSYSQLTSRWLDENTDS